MAALGSSNTVSVPSQYPPLHMRCGRRMTATMYTIFLDVLFLWVTIAGTHAVGKMVAATSPSHNAAEWACVYTNLFSTDAAWADSEACYEYFNSL